MGWAEIENAIQLEVRTRLGYPTASVVWSHQNLPRVAPGVELSITADNPAGPDDTSHYWRNEDDEFPGEEITHVVRSTRLFTLLVGIRTAEVKGNSTARSLLTAVSMALSFQSVIDTFDAAGFSVLSVGGVTSVPEIRHVDWEGRASIEIACTTSLELEEYNTYIEEVWVTATTPDPDETIVVG